MYLIRRWPTGWEEYQCSACSRAFFVHLPGQSDVKIILDEGEPVDHLYMIGEDIDPKWLEPYERFLRDQNDGETSP